MKKNLLFILFLLVVLIGGCRKKNKAITINDFLQAVDGTNASVIYGIEYEKIQINNNLIVYKNTVNSQVVSYENSKAKVYFYEKKLDNFPSDNQFIEKEYTKYYDDINVILVEGEEVKTISETLKTLKLDLNVKSLLDTNNIINYTINDKSISINVKKESMESISHVNEVTDFKVIMTMLEGKIVNIKVNYTINNSDFSLTYNLFYTSFDESILTIN